MLWIVCAKQWRRRKRRSEQARPAPLLPAVAFGHVRNRRGHRKHRGTRDHPRRHRAPRVQGLRLRRGRTGQRRRHVACPRSRRHALVGEAAQGRRERRAGSERRHRPHPLGDARPPDGAKRPPAHRLHRNYRCGPQRHSRELVGARERAARSRSRPRVRHRHRDRRPPRRVRARRGGRAGGGGAHHPRHVARSVRDRGRVLFGARDDRRSAARVAP